MEGPCGTGKTMAALTAGATLVRDTDLYERMVVVTPVKQQLQQFVDDLRTLNAGIEEPFDGISLVGKRDLCPYGREGQFPDDVSTHDRCEDLREATARLVEDGGRSDGAASRTPQSPVRPTTTSGGTRGRARTSPRSRVPTPPTRRRWATTRSRQRVRTRRTDRPSRPPRSRWPTDRTRRCTVRSKPIGTPATRGRLSISRPARNTS